MRLSAVVLTKNSEETIKKTLDSLSFCDELIIIDDYSTDKTLQIVRKYPLIIHQRHLGADFSGQRNFGLAKASNDWVLFVDSDEVVSKDLYFEIRKAIEHTGYDGFYLRRQDMLWGKKLQFGEIGAVRLLRLGKKGKGEWSGKVHEVWNITGRTGELSFPLLHFPHKGIGQFLSQINTYTSIRAKELFEENISVHFWDILFYPAGKFLVNYFFRLGFLDGIQGLMVAILMSFHSFLVRCKLWQLYDQKKQ